jgi:hypothetical protein
MAPEIDLNNQINRFGFRVWLDQKIQLGEGYHKLRSQGESGLEDTYVVDNEPLIVETDGKVEGRLSKAFVSDNHSKGIKISCTEVVFDEIEVLRRTKELYAEN